MGLWSKQKTNPYPRRMSLHGRTPCALHKKPYLLYLVLHTSSIRLAHVLNAILSQHNLLAASQGQSPDLTLYQLRIDGSATVRAYGLAKVRAHGSTYGEPKVQPLGRSLSERQKDLSANDKKTPASVTVLIRQVELICPAGLTACSHKLGSLDLTIMIVRSQLVRQLGIHAGQSIECAAWCLALSAWYATLSPGNSQACTRKKVKGTKVEAG